MSVSTNMEGFLKSISDKISEIYDLDLAEEFTDIYEDLVTRVKGSSKRYWNLVKTLATIEKERDELRKELEEERRLRLQAEYDKEYYAMRLMEHMD